VWFKHRAWIPTAWILCVLNVGATWFAARPGEAAHATVHALLAVLFGVGAQLLTARRRALGVEGAELGELGAPRQDTLRAHTEMLERLERSVDAIALEMERVGEAQRYLTKVLADPARRPPEPR
jgi:hypothetical protein